MFNFRFLLIFYAGIAYAQSAIVIDGGIIKPATGGGGGGGTITLISHGTATANGSGATATTGTIACTGANLYAVGVASSTANTATVHDGQGHTFNLKSNHSDSVSGGKSAIYIVENVTGASTTFSVAADFPSIYVACFSNTNSGGSFDAATGTSNDQSSGVATINCGTLTPAGNELILDQIVWSATVSSIDNSYTLLDSNAFSNGNFYGGALAYKVQSGSQSPNWTVTSGNGSCDLATFK